MPPPEFVWPAFLGFFVTNIKIAAITMMIATIMTHVLVLLFISITAYKAKERDANGCSRHDMVFVLKYSSMEKKKSFIHRTALIFRPFWKYCAIMAGILFLGQGVAALAPLFFGKTVDAVIHHNAHATIVFVLIAISERSLKMVSHAFRVLLSAKA